MFRPEVGLLEIVARTALVYLVLLVGLRLAGKREIGQMTPFDLVVILLIANAVQNAMVGPDTSVTGGLVAAGVLVVANSLVAFLRERVPWLRRDPTLLVQDGVFLEHNLRRENVDHDEVLMALREHGVEAVEDVRLAVLETDGTISVVPASSEAPQRTRRKVRFRHSG